MIIQYVELQDVDCVIDIYGYADEVVVWDNGSPYTFRTKGPEATKRVISKLVETLTTDYEYEVINEEVR